MIKLKVSGLLIFIYSLIYGAAFAQPPDLLWTRTYGSDSNQEARDVQQTDDGGFIVAARNPVIGPGYYSNFWLLKTDASGDTMWASAYGTYQVDFANGVKQTPDGGYIIAGVTHEYDADYTADIYVVKTDANGTQQWAESYGGGGRDWAYDVTVSPDSGYVVVGYSTSYGGAEEMYMIKLNPTGYLLWSKTYGGAEDENCWSIEKTFDGGYILVGTTYSYGYGLSDIFLVKTDSNGDSLWTKYFGGNYQDYGYDVKQTLDGGYVVAGQSDISGDPNWQYYLAKLDADGNLLWERDYGSADLAEFARSVDITADGGFILGGDTGVFGRDIYVLRTDQSGDLLWDESYGTTENDKGYAIQTTSDGGYIVCGSTGSFYPSIYLLRFAPENPSYVIEGLPDELEVSKNYPNPFNARTTIAYTLPEKTNVCLEIFDLSGRKVETLVDAEKVAGRHQITWNAVNFASGVYFYKLQLGDYVTTKKMSLVK